MVPSTAFPSNSILLCFSIFFLIIDLYFLNPVLTAQVFSLASELAITAGTSNILLYIIYNNIFYTNVLYYIMLCYIILYYKHIIYYLVILSIVNWYNFYCKRILYESNTKKFSHNRTTVLYFQYIVSDMFIFDLP